jgi:serine/threonine protein kinase
MYLSSSCVPCVAVQFQLLYILLLQAVNYIHQQGMVHCDLAPENLVEFSTYQLRVVDFDRTCKAGQYLHGMAVSRD